MPQRQDVLELLSQIPGRYTQLTAVGFDGFCITENGVVVMMVPPPPEWSEPTSPFMCVSCVPISLKPALEYANAAGLLTVCWDTDHRDGCLYLTDQGRLELMHWLESLKQAENPPAGTEKPARADEMEAQLRPYLEELFTVAEIADMINRDAGTIKSEHKAEWGKPDETAAGRHPARWTLRKVLPALRKQFPGKIHPPKRGPCSAC